MKNHILILICTFLACAGARASDERPFTVDVMPGKFDVFVIESARLDARQSVTLASELPSNEGKIIWLVDEGTYLSEGDLVAKFDPAPFEEDIANLNREYQDGMAALAQAEAELQIQIRAGQDSVEKAEYAAKVAELKLQNLTRADHPLRITTADSEVLSAKIALDRARQEHQAQREMINEGFGNENMLKEAAALEQEKQSAVNLAIQRRRLLEDAIIPAEIRQAELEIENRGRELKNSEQMRLYALGKQKNILVRLRNQLAVLEDSRRHAEKLLAKTAIYAPVSGFAIYKSIPVTNERRKVQVGDSVWNRHGFIVLPDMSSMVAHINIRELSIGKLAVGQAVTLKPEAYPGMILSGRVDLVGTLVADAADRDENFFQVRVALDDVDPRLRPGMRAQASILTSSYTDVLRVPIETVFYFDGKAICFVWDDDEARPHSVQLGASDGEYVVVEAGLEAGQQVLLTRPRQAFNPDDFE